MGALGAIEQEIVNIRARQDVLVRNKVRIVGVGRGNVWRDDNGCAARTVKRPAGR